jgi:uncharacterized delta-60 repeat protein/uncharacterized repeat protein (TIGR02543 family)
MKLPHIRFNSTIVVKLFLATLIFPIFFFPGSLLAEEGNLPDPQVTITIENNPTPTVTSATFLNGQFASMGDELECIISLSNAGDEANGGGIFIQVDGGEFSGDIYDMTNFDEAVGLTEGAQQIPVNGAHIVELYAYSSYATNNTGSARFKIRVTSESGYVNISLRGWLFDGDDDSQNPVTGLNEPYTARYPHHYPDGRFVGENFTEYRTFVFNIYPNYLQQLIDDYTIPGENSYTIIRVNNIGDDIDYFILYRQQIDDANPSGILVIDHSQKQALSRDELGLYAPAVSAVLDGYRHDLSSFYENASIILRNTYLMKAFADVQSQLIDSSELWEYVWTWPSEFLIKLVACQSFAFMSGPGAPIVEIGCAISDIISLLQLLSITVDIYGSESLQIKLSPHLEMMKDDCIEVDWAWDGILDKQLAFPAWNIFTGSKYSLILRDYINYLNGIKELLEDLREITDPFYLGMLNDILAILGFDLEEAISIVEETISEKELQRNDFEQQESIWRNRCTLYRQLIRNPNQGLKITPQELTFSANEAESPSSQVLSIQNTGCGSIEWNITYKSNWIVADKSSGSTPDEINISVDLSELSPGTHEGLITIASSNYFVSPISVDVTLEYLNQTTHYYGPTEDTFVDSMHPEQNFGEASTIRVGSWFNTLDSGRYGFVKFSIDDIIGEQVASAILRLYVADMGESSVTISVHRRADEWEEYELVYNDGTGPPGNPFNGEGDYVTITVHHTGWYEWDVSELVRDWAQRGEPNNGFYLTPVNFNFSTILFSSRESSNPPELNLEMCEGAPDLIVSCIEPKISGEYVSPPFYVGQRIYFRTTVTNIGNGCVDEKFYTAYYLEDNPTSLNNFFDRESLDEFITAGQSVREGEYYTFLESDIGTRYVNILVDSNYDVNELDETNNMRSYGPFEVLPEQDFSLEVSPPTRTIKQGDDTDFSITIQPQSGFDSSVTLSASVPSGIDYTFSNNPITPSEYSIINISSASSIAPDVYPIIIEGQGGDKQHSVTVNLEVLDGVAPTVTINNPTSEPSYETDTTPITISGSASDDRSLDRVTINTGDINNGTPENWDFTVDLVEGDNVITVTAKDTAGNEANDTIIVNNSLLTSSITIDTYPAGIQITTDGSDYTAPQTFEWVQDSEHTIGVASPQSGEGGTQYVYDHWSDGGDQNHTITVPTSNTTYTAYFNRQYSLTTSTNPPGGGIVSPSDTTWHDSGIPVDVTAIPNADYTFSGWSGDATGTENPLSVTMDSPKDIVANFICSAPAPAIPENPSPADGAADISRVADLDWDDCNGANAYDVYFGPVSPPPYDGTVASSFYDLGILEYNTKYYWQIVAKNNCGDTTGDVWQFTTGAPESPDQWAITYGGSSIDYHPFIQKTSDGGYILGGGTESFGAGNEDFWVVKINDTGAVIWEKTYGGTNDEFAYSIEQTLDSGYIVTGGTQSFGAGADDFWVLKLNADGTVAWQKTYGGNSTDYGRSIQQTPDGTYVAAGYTGSFGAGNEDFWVLKLNDDGTVAWQKTYGGNNTDQAYAIQQTSDSGYIVVGRTWSFGAGNSDLWVLKLNDDGTVAWQKTYGGVNHECAFAIQQTTDGGYIVTGGTSSSGAGSDDLWVLKLNADGTVAWQKTYGGNSNDYGRSIQETPDGTYVVAGLTYSFGEGDDDLWVLKLNADGTVAWQKIYGGSNDDFGFSIQQTSDGGYTVASGSGSFGAGNYDSWVLHIDANGEIPGCSAMGTSDAVVSDSSATGGDTSVVPQDSSAVPADTTITPQNTSAETSEICLYEYEPIVWHVDGDMAVSGDGTSWPQAFKTIQEAIVAASDGNEIWVKMGTYYLSSQINVDQAVAIYGGFNGTENQKDQRDFANNVTTVDGQDSVRCFYVTADALVDGFTITHGYDANQGGGICCNNTSLIVSNNIISDNYADWGAAIRSSGSSMSIIGNVIKENDGIAGICTLSGTNIEVLGNIMTDNLDCTIITFALGSKITQNIIARNAYGIYLEGASDSIITSNTIVDNESRGIFVDNSDNVTVQNNIIYFNKGIGIAAADSDVLSKYNDVQSYDAWAEGNIITENDICENPCIDINKNDYHLRPGSPCIDAGTSAAPELPNTDFEGDPRIIGAAPDMGADESWFLPVKKGFVISPSGLGFGEVQVGSTGQLSLIMYNGKDTDIGITDCTDPSAPYTIIADGCSGFILSSGDTCSITVEFAPTSIGNFYDYFLISTDDPAIGTKQIGLSGQGVSE